MFRLLPEKNESEGSNGGTHGASRAAIWSAPKPRRTEPYERTPPAPRKHNWRMAWAGAATAHNAAGEPLKTRRYAADAEAPTRRDCAASERGSGSSADS